MDLREKIEVASGHILKKLEGKPTPVIGLILGSGLGALADDISNPVYVSYDEIPQFLKSTVSGHEGRLVIGEMGGKMVIAMQGRFHFYEGYPVDEITIPVRVMAKIGVKTLIVTNAAGAVNESLEPGDLMIIEDHLNFANCNPLIGKNLDEFGPRFPDTSGSYDPSLIEMVSRIADKLGINIKKGVYQFSSGPTYETPAETKVARSLGADVVGMSTVPEVLAAVHSGMKVLGISCVTNMAAGILDQPLDHGEVIQTGSMVREQFIELVKEVLKEI